MRFCSRLELDGRTATGIPVPEEVLAALGGGRRPRVVATLGAHRWRTAVGAVDGEPRLPVSAAVREAAGVAAGDVVDVRLELDTAPRTVVLPADLAAALATRPAARAFYDGLSYSRQKAWATWVADARREETRRERLARTVEALAAGVASR